MWQLVYIKRANKDAKKVVAAGLKPKVEKLLHVLKNNPYQTPPSYEKLLGDLAGGYSRRINIQHRMIYQPINEIKVVKVISMWTHYE